MKPSEASAGLWQQSLLGKDLSRTALGRRAEVKGQAAAETAPALGRTQPLLPLQHLEALPGSASAPLPGETVCGADPSFSVLLLGASTVSLTPPGPHFSCYTAVTE